MSCHSTLPPMKECTCCPAKYCADTWASLVLVAARWDIGGDGVDVVEARNCACGSTLAIDLSEGGSDV